MTGGEVPGLRSLSPTYVAEQHQVYVDILKTELSKTGADAPLNVALTGHYGSGKSSVLVETQRQLNGAGFKVINLSLPSLGIGSGRTPKNGDTALDTTNLIQKEIVKQLLYRRKPSDTPASRYNRLDTFQSSVAYWRAGIVSIAVTGLALLLKVPYKVRDSLPVDFWEWLDTRLWGSLSGLIQWLSLVFVFIMTFVVAMWLLRLFQQRLRITELAAGPTKVTLSESSSSYFDEYLDEIVYFFQTSKTAVVIFEDLDRFKDPHIFETLRELNLLLNNAEQTGSAPIRFVYAIRDSIFEQLDSDGGAANTDGTGVADERGIPSLILSKSDIGESRRLMSTNRTKFFDLVVPMVPFISHRTSRDLIRGELGATGSSKQPSNAVVDIVGAHLTDMRLIKNICNEYEVFRRRILTDDGLKELTSDRLFASIVYKNLYLADYEKIRDGASRLDSLYDAYREWVTHQTTEARLSERRARLRLRRIDSIASRSARLGKRLREILIAKQQQPIPDNVEVSIGGSTYTWSDLLTAGFWRACLEGGGDLNINYPSMYQGREVLSFDKMQTLIGWPLSIEDWSEEDRADTADALETAVRDQRSLAKVSMMGALAEPDRLFPYRGKERSVIDVAEELFDGTPLCLELLRSGFIDENFTLYITQFPGQTISASAMNFVIKAVQPDVMDIDYHFGSGEHADSNDIKAVLEAESERLFGGQSVYNIEIFDYLLAFDSDELDEPIRRLATNAPNDRKFLDAYLTSGARAATLVRRLSGLWPDIFSYIVEQGPEAESVNPMFIGAALAGVHPDLTYVVDHQERNAIMDALPNLEIITDEQTPERARDIARVLEQLNVRTENLSAVAEPLKAEVIARNLYPLSLPNLRVILPEQCSSLSLDAIKTFREADVYPHVLNHLHKYFAVLDEAEAQSVDGKEHFSAVLGDVASVRPDALEDVARRANPQCMLERLDELDPGLWPSVASAHRFELSAQNVAAYVSEHGVDKPIAGFLSASGAIETDDDGTPLVPLALDLLNAETLAGQIKLAIVESLHLDCGSIPAQGLGVDAHLLLPALVESGFVSDDLDAYRCLGDNEWPTKEALLEVSAAFPTYAASLDLTADDLDRIASSLGLGAAKAGILAALGGFADNLSSTSAVALAWWAARGGQKVAVDSILVLATAGGAASAQPILKLLGASAEVIDVAPLKAALDAIQTPYNQLTKPGRDRPKVPITDGVAPILERLKREGIVSKYDQKKKSWKPVFEVSKRHF